MRFGLFSDVHANLEAFQAVAGSLRREKIDQYVFLGDLVGYGADPRACVQLLRELKKEKPCFCLAGNHDYAVAGKAPQDKFVLHARVAVRWTQQILGKNDLNFLAAFLLEARTAYFMAVHASPVNPWQWLYIMDTDEASQNFQAFTEPICFIGHSHVPVVFSLGETIDRFIQQNIFIEKGKRYIINIGSVGQPRDGNPHAAFAIYDTRQSQVSIRRVVYDVASAQGKIIKAGLPGILADRLSCGK